MKRTLYILGVVCIIIMLLGFIFKVTHFPGAGIAITLAMLLLSFWFFPAAFIKNYKSGDNKKYKVLYLLAFISIFFDVLGGLFKIMHWPGANILMLIGIPLPFILFLPAYIYYHNKYKLKSDKNFFAIMFFMVYVGVISALLAVDVSKEVLYAPISSYNSFINIKEYQSYKNQIQYDNLKDEIEDHKKLADLKNLKTKTNDLLGFIQKLNYEIVKNDGEYEAETIPDQDDINLLVITWKNPSITPDALKLYPKKNSKLIQLKNSIENYKSFIGSIEKSNKYDFEIINSLFELIDVELNPEGTENKKLELYKCSAFTSLSNLSGMQSTIRQIENEALELISKNVPN